MIRAVLLGIRLAGAGVAAGGAKGVGSARLRSGLVALAAAVGTLIMLLLAGIVHSESAGIAGGLVDQEGMPQLLAAIVITISLPVLVLAATAGKLSAAIRDQRLSNLRLLGMTPLQTRVVAAVETGIAACVGTGVGWVLSFPARALLATWHPASVQWTFASLTPGAVGYIVILIAVPLAVTVISASARGGRSRQVLAGARRADARRPGWWRVIPLAAGIGVAVYLLASQGDEMNEDIFRWVIVAMVLLGLGVVLVVPSLVRLVADVLVRLRRSPASVTAGRRLQAQPAGTSRIVAGLLIALFVVAGARAIVGAWEATPQYLAAATIDTTGQSATVHLAAAPAQAQRGMNKLTEQDWVKGVATLSVLRTVCSDETNCMHATVIVGNCTDLSSLFGSAPKCRDDQTAWIYGPMVVPGGLGSTLTLTAPKPESIGFGGNGEPAPMSGSQTGAEAPGANESETSASGGNSSAARTLTVPTPAYTLSAAVARGLESSAAIFVPEKLVAESNVMRHPGPDAKTNVVVVANPGVAIETKTPGTAFDYLGDAFHGSSAPNMQPYHYAAGLRTLVWSVAAVVLAVGLLAFGIGALDRAISRRRELVSLQLVGVGPKFLRRTQWIEAALPLGIGIVLAIAAGALAGASYLAYGLETNFLPWRDYGALAGVSVAAAIVIAGLTVIAASPRIRPEFIRTE